MEKAMTIDVPPIGLHVILDTTCPSVALTIEGKDSTGCRLWADTQDYSRGDQARAEAESWGGVAVTPSWSFISTTPT